ncbi:MAG: alpha/beta hydrolase [Pseudomonadota bacterium]
MPQLVSDGLTISYVDQGAGPIVVLLHSSGASSRQWRPLIEGHVSSYRFLAPDLIGYGGTGRRDMAGYSPDHEVALVGALLDQFDQPVYLVGHSYGGAVALGAARAFDNRVRGVIAIEPVLFQVLRAAGETEAWTEIEAVATTHIGHVDRGDLIAAADGFMGYWVGAKAWAAMPESTRAAIIGTMPKIADEWRALLTSSVRADDFCNIAAPIHFIRAEHTTLAAGRVTDVLLAALPDARLSEVKAAGHLSPMTHAEVVNPLIVETLLGFGRDPG